jgi:hypothetical protein
MIEILFIVLVTLLILVVYLLRQYQRYLKEYDNSGQLGIGGASVNGKPHKLSFLQWARAFLDF